MAHGLADTPANLKPLAKYLRNMLGAAIKIKIHLHKFECRGPNTQIEAQANEIVDKITSEPTQRNTIRIFIGHSRGGIIVTEAERILAKLEYNISLVICIGTPFQGANSAYLMQFWKSVAQMTKRSRFLNKINEETVWDKYVFIKDTQDLIVINPFPIHAPSSSCYKLGGGGHLSTMRSKKVWEKTVTLIENCIESFDAEPVPGVSFFNSIKI